MFVEWCEAIEPGLAQEIREAFPGMMSLDVRGADGVALARERNSTGQLAGLCAVWHGSDSPERQGEKVGRIGAFAATSAAATKLLLDAACLRCKEAGCGLVVGPMDGTTWRRYRFISRRGEVPPFFMEPNNPEEYPRWWQEAGFEVDALYFSALVDDLKKEDPRLARVKQRLAQSSGLRIRSIELERFSAELEAIHALSLIAFASNHLYSPIGAAEFVAMYEPLRARVVPELVQVAECQGRVAGYCFGIPNFVSANEAKACVIVKTVAVMPGRLYAGLGNLLVAEVHKAATEQNFTRGIHALMHRSNNSLNLSAHYGNPFREYVLFVRKL
jgi:GNAT superfamily N-acetyltransferase